MAPIFKILSILMLLLSGTELAAQTRIVNSTSNDALATGTLPYWLLNADNGDIIDCSAIQGQSISLTSSLPAITKSYTINGAGITINGNNLYQAFQIAEGTVVIQNVTVQNAISKGGNGGNGYSGGGGGVGGGGAIYIHGGTNVTLTDSTLRNNIAQGGNGGDGDNNGIAGGGGGGGFNGGNGGDALTISTGGGGGSHSNGGNGGSDTSINGSNGIYYGGGGGGGGNNFLISGGNGGNASPNGNFQGGNQSSGNGGGGAGNSQDGESATGSLSAGTPGDGGYGIGTDFLFGGGGGGGCASESSNPGGGGIGAAGGGGSNISIGGAGGILGGGGGGSGGTTGGAGGFGAGGGGSTSGGIGGGNFNAGGGNGGSDSTGNAGGGGGSGLGGAIFIQSDSTLTIMDAQQISNNNAVAGTKGSSNTLNLDYIPAEDGKAMGQDIFVRETGTIIFNLSNTLSISTPIEGDQTNGPNTNGGLQKIGNGILNLNGANTYSGTTTVNAGILNLNGSVIGNLQIESGGTLSGNASSLGNMTNSGIIHIDIDASGSNSLVSTTGLMTLAGTLEISLNSNAQLKTYDILTSSAITGSFNNITFKEITPVNYSISYLPTKVQLNLIKVNGSQVTGKGTISGGSIGFNVKASYNSRHQIVADMFYNDAGKKVHFDNPVVTALTFNGNSVVLSGTTRVNNQPVQFTATLTGGNPGSLSLRLSNGYSASGNLTSGRINVQ